MKRIKLFETIGLPRFTKLTEAVKQLTKKEDIEKMLTDSLSIYNKFSWEIKDDLSVDISGDIDLKKMSMSSGLPFKINIVTGDMTCYYGNLETLKNFPKEVGGSIYLCGNKLKSLKHFPKKVGCDIDVSGNQLVSMEHLPTIVTGTLNVSNNNIKNFEKAPEKARNFYGSNNKFKTLIGSVGVVDSFWIDNNPLTTLEGAPRRVSGSFECSNCELENLVGAPEFVGGSFDCTYNNIKNVSDLDVKITIKKDFRYSRGNDVKNFKQVDARLTESVDGSII